MSSTGTVPYNRSVARMQNRVKLNPVSILSRVTAAVWPRCCCCKAADCQPRDSSSTPKKKQQLVQSQQEEELVVGVSAEEVVVQEGTCAAQEVHGRADHQAAQELCGLQRPAAHGAAVDRVPHARRLHRRGELTPTSTRARSQERWPGSPSATRITWTRSIPRPSPPCRRRSHISAS